MKQPMEPLVDTLIEDARWNGVELAVLADRAGAATLVALDLPATGFTLCVMGCDDTRIAVLNADFRGKAQPTNVLSWPSEMLGESIPGVPPARPLPGTRTAPRAIGDIALAWETCLAEAEAGHISVSDHVTHLIVHGMLHCLGYDHDNDADAVLMETTETRILVSLGIADPYAVPTATFTAVA